MVIGVSQIGAPADISGVRSGCEAVDFTILMACIWGSATWGRPMAAAGQNLAYRRAAYRAGGGYAKVPCTQGQYCGEGTGETGTLCPAG